MPGNITNTHFERIILIFKNYSDNNEPSQYA